jgi:hypothetical protein
VRRKGAEGLDDELEALVAKQVANDRKERFGGLEDARGGLRWETRRSHREQFRLALQETLID